MALRGLVVVLIVAATAAFVVGVAIERGDEAGHHDEAAEVAPVSGEAGATGEANSEAGEGEAAHADGESVAASGESSEETETELRPLGIDIDKGALALLAGLVAVLHAAAALVAAGMSSRARRPDAGAPGAAGTMPA